MSHLDYWNKKIQEKRRLTSWKQYIKEIASWLPLAFYKRWWNICRYPDSDRVNEKLLSPTEFTEYRETLTEQWYVYDFTKGFFENFSTLFKSVNLSTSTNLLSAENANYADRVAWSKNVYLSNIVVVGCENVMYSVSVKDQCRNIYNTILAWDHCENVYMWFGIIRWFNIFYSRYIYNCSDIRFSQNLLWCHECLFCNDLENKSYYIHNKQLTKKLYFEEKKKILSKKPSFYDWYLSLNIQGKNLASTCVQGDFIIQSEDITQSKLVYRNKGGHNLFLVWWEKWNENMFDCIVSWSPYSSDCYAICNSWKIEHGYIGDILWSCSHVYYSFDLHHCSYCLWCVWLKNKDFCIFNKQYSKEDWFGEVDKIFQIMKNEWVLGEYFPSSMNPFNYNDTLAYLIEDIPEEEVRAEGYLWRDKKMVVDIPSWLDVVNTQLLDQYRWNEEILEKVIQDQDGEIYRISAMEYWFLETHSLPLPRYHRFTTLKNHLRENNS